MPSAESCRERGPLMVLGHCQHSRAIQFCVQLQVRTLERGRASHYSAVSQLSASSGFTLPAVAAASRETSCGFSCLPLGAQRDSVLRGRAGGPTGVAPQSRSDGSSSSGKDSGAHFINSSTPCKRRVTRGDLASRALRQGLLDRPRPLSSHSALGSSFSLPPAGGTPWRGGPEQVSSRVPPSACPRGLS